MNIISVDVYVSQGAKISRTMIRGKDLVFSEYSDHLFKRALKRTEISYDILPAQIPLQSSNTALQLEAGK